MTKVEELKKMYENMGGDPEAVADKTLITEMLDAMSELELSELPEVTADDNGDVLTVVEGAWAKATPVVPENNVVIFNSSGITNLSTDSTVTLSGSTLLDVKNALIAGKIPIIHVGGTSPTTRNTFFLYPSLVYDGGSNYLHFRAIVMIDGHEYIAKTSFNITTSSPGNTLSVSTLRLALYSDIPTT